ncbi:hypothetical protein ABZ639_28925 [Saccharomonospora sp. NPDC006951]
MGDGFHADPDQIAGYGVLVDKVADQTLELAEYFLNAEGDSGFTGAMSLLKPSVDAYAQAACDRFRERGSRMLATAAELNRAAWVYSGADEDAYTSITTSAGGAEEVVKDYPDPASYKMPNDATGDLGKPESEEADIRALLDEVGGILNKIDDVVNDWTGWSPTAEIVEPMSGNWNSLTAAGEVLAEAGGAAEHVAANLTEPLADLDPHWTGGAANDLHDHIGDQAKVIGLEGPLNRIVGDVYALLAILFEKIAGWMVEKLKDAVDKIVEAIPGSWVPGYGWYKWGEAVFTAFEIVKQAKELVETLKTAVENVERMIEIAKDPVNEGLSELKSQFKELEKVQQIETAVEEVTKGAEFASDVAELSDTEPWEDEPDEEYGLGKDPERA